MSKLFMILLVLFVAACSAFTAGCQDGKKRHVRFWTGSNIVNESAGPTCTPAFFGNLTKFAPAMDSLAPMMWKLSHNSTGPTLTLNDGSLTAPALFQCLHDVRAKFNISIGVCGSTDETSISVAASNPPAYAAAVQEFLTKMPFTIDELWTDFEIKDCCKNGTNHMHALMQQLRPTFRYAGCEPRDAPYFAESCKAFAEGTPGVVIQAANTYWSDTVSAGWYGGFEHLLQQEIDSIGTENIGVLSPAICPACATGDDSDDNLTQQQLYDRMDIVCTKGITDFSAFTFFEIVDRTAGGDVGARYMEALSYFRTGKKGLVI